MDARIIGGYGESRAAAHLRERGYDIVAANFRTRFGEVDVIAADKRYLLFVEVKTRRSASFALPRESVTKQKQRRIILAAQAYLAQHPTQLQPRFDVVEVMVREQGGALSVASLNHIENAFTL